MTEINNNNPDNNDGGNTPPNDPNNQPPQDDSNQDDDNLKIEFEDDGASPDPIEPPANDPTPPNPKPSSRDDDDDDDDKVDVQKQIDDRVRQETEPLRRQAEQMRVENEWGKIKGEYPELEPYEAKILRYANHERYRGKPVREALLDVAGMDIFTKIGAIRQRKADEEANRNNITGNSTNNTATNINHKNVLNTNIPSFKGKTLAEIKKIQADHRRGIYNK